MDKYYEASSDAVDTFNEVLGNKIFSVSIGFKFLGASKQKQLIKIKKISDEYSFLMGKDVLVSINEDLLSVFDEESISILIEQEIDKINVNSQSGKITIIKPDLNTFSSLIKKYGIDKVSKANQVESLYDQQVKDGVEEFDFK